MRFSRSGMPLSRTSWRHMWILFRCPFERHFIAMQKDAGVEMLPLDQALERAGIVAITLVEFAHIAPSGRPRAR